jgi:hypothetical protein
MKIIEIPDICLKKLSALPIEIKTETIFQFINITKRKEHYIKDKINHKRYSPKFTQT